MYKHRMLTARVGIAGCGGLGSNCAVALARAGIGHLIIADFDTVSLSNLNRQYFFMDQIGLKKCNALKDNIARIDPNIHVDAHDVKLDPVSIVNLFDSCDIIVEAFDLAEMKQMLIETVLTHFPEKYIVGGLGIAGWGHNEIMRTEQYERLYICGDFITEVSDLNPPLAPRVGIVAHMQANKVMEIIMNLL